MLTDWFASKNVDGTIIFYTIFITVPLQVCSITNEIIPLQSGSVFYERAKLTGVLYKHRVIFAMDGCLLFIGIIYSDILDKANYSDPLRTKIDERKKNSQTSRLL